MNFSKKYFLIVFLFVHIEIIAQNITGCVVDDNNNPLIGASIVLLSPQDSSYIASSSTGNNGLFSISEHGMGKILVASFIGFQTTYKTIEDNTPINITLHENSKLLHGVTITGKHIVNHAQGYKLTLSGTGLENSNTIQEAFAFLPGMAVKNDKITLYDKTPVIYVNGIKITSQEELAALQPKQIENINVNLLGVGEDAREKGGVIRITTKRQPNGGYSGFLMGMVGWLPEYGSDMQRPLFSVNANINKWSINYYASYVHRKLIGDNTDDYHYDSGDITKTYSETRSNANYYLTRLNIAYELGKHSQLAFSQWLYFSDFNNRNNSTVNYLHRNTQTAPPNRILLHGPEKQQEQQTVVKYQLATDTLGSLFEVTTDYMHRGYQFHQKQDINDHLSAEHNTRESTYMYCIKPKYTHELGRNKSLEFGSKYQYIDYDDTAENRESSGRMHVASGYANFSERNKTIMYSIGLQLQNNSMKVTSEQNTTSFNDTYLCPWGSFRWTIHQKSGMTLLLTYRHTVEDMPYSVINQYKKYTTPNSYITGNPSLTTPTNHQMMLDFSFNKHIDLTFFYHRLKDPIYYTHGIDANNNSITCVKPENGRYEQSFNVRLEFSYSPTKWWRTKLYSAIDKTDLATKEEKMSGKWSIRFGLNNNFTFLKTFGVSLNGYYESYSRFEYYHWKPVGRIETSLWKTWMNDKFRINISGTIWARGRKSITEGNGYYLFHHNTTKTTAFDATFTWNFSAGKRAKQRISAESVQSYHLIEERK